MRTRTGLGLMWVVLTCAGAFACGDDEPDSQSTDNLETTETVTETNEPTTASETNEPETVSETNEPETVPETDEPDPTVSEDQIAQFLAEAEGRYAHYDIVAYLSNMGALGVFKTLIISYGFTEFKLEDGKLIATDRFCHSEQKSNQSFVPSVPDALTQAIVPESVEMEVRQTEDGGLALYRPETPTLLGIEYEDAANTPLPKTIKPNDPRLVDDDFDGKPGVTVFIQMMGKQEEIYIARREIFAFEAGFQSNGNIEGLVFDRSEQLVIDATNFLLKIQQDWKQYEDLSKSPIILVPIDDSYDCEKLMAERDALFPPNPEIWK